MILGSTGRTWNCKIFSDLWGDKTYELKDEDFCKRQWYKTAAMSSMPSCDKHTAPIITFYARGTLICMINMSKGRDRQYQECVKVVAQAQGMFTKNEGIAIIKLFKHKFRTTYLNRYGKFRHYYSLNFYLLVR